MQTSRGRPSDAESRRRRARFLTLCAQGEHPEAAMVQARVSARVVVRLLADPDRFQQTLAAMRSDEVTAA